MSNIAPSKRRARLLDPGVKIVGEPYDPAHPSMGTASVIVSSDGRRLARSQHARIAWVNACKVLEREKAAQ